MDTSVILVIGALFAVGLLVMVVARIVMLKSFGNKDKKPPEDKQ